MVKNMRCQIVIILISALIGAAISAFFVAKESDKYIEHRLNADKVKLQIESDIDGLEYLVSSNYSKRESDERLPVNEIENGVFIIDRKADANKPQKIYVIIKNGQKRIGNFVIKLSLFKADALDPTETDIKANIKWNDRLGECKITLTRHEWLFMTRKESEQLRLMQGVWPEAAFGI